MNSFTINKNIVFYLVIFLIVIPIFGLNFLISFLGNILLLLILVPFLRAGLGLLEGLFGDIYEENYKTRSRQK